MSKKNIKIYVLNYNGSDYIKPCIDSLLLAIQNSAYRCQLVIIDNRSTDGSVPFLKTEYPRIPVTQMSENRVLCSFNQVVAQNGSDLVFLLNNDLKADPFFIDPMVSIFEEKSDAFLVAAKSYLFDGSYEGGRSIPFILFGLFGTTCRFPNHQMLIDRGGITFAAGFGAFDRAKFLALGGYDDLYLPGRLEDADLAFRAWRMGWKCYYQPKSILYHIGGKSFKERFGSRKTMELAHRNTFLFMWKNLESNTYWIQHFLFLIPRLFWMLLKGHYEFVTGFLKAIGKLSAVLQRRKQEKGVRYMYTDKEVFSFFKNGN